MPLPSADAGRLGDSCCSMCLTQRATAEAVGTHHFGVMHEVFPYPVQTQQPPLTPPQHTSDRPLLCH